MKYKNSANILLYKSENPSSNNIKGNLKKDTIVEISKKKENGWFYVNSNYIEGWSFSIEYFKEYDEPENTSIHGDSRTNNKANVNYTGKVTYDTLKIYNSTNTSSGVASLAPKGDLLHITKMVGDWYYVKDRGYIYSGYGGFIIDISNQTTDVKVNPDEESQFNLSADYYTYDSVSDAIDSNSAAELILSSSRGIFGMPYQYMASCDPKLQLNSGSSPYGRKFASKIVQNMPLLLITPGRPKFMKKFNKGDKATVLSALAKKDDATLNELLNSSNGKFYSMEFNYSDYYKVVNPMLKNIARLLKLNDKKIDGKSVLNYDWQGFAEAKLQGFLSSKESVAFYIDSETQINETFSNGTSQSSLAGSLNQLSDISREIQFLMGAGTGEQLEALRSDNYESTRVEMDKLTKNFGSILPSTLIDRLSEGALTVASGGKLIFPEIWSDSEFTKSYDVNIKLRTPNPTPFGIYMDILVPLCHLIGLTAPVQLNGNGYTSPFMVRAYYKGFFNIDMGIITSLSITKGDKGCWTLDGLPTQIDVSLQIKDLYNVFSLSTEDKISNMLSNTAEMDYLANLCGININKIDIDRSIKYYYYNIKEGLENKFTFNHFLGVQTYISNAARNIFR